MEVELLAYTPHPEGVVYTAARLCYSSKGIQELVREEGVPTKRLIEQIKASGHHSVLEHASFTFGIEGVSRVTTHQLVRHRIASYSQKSQRYVAEGAFEYILPPTVGEKKEARELFERVMDTCREAYNRLLDMGVPKEDARYLLPSGCETKIIVTMNARELLHFFSLRCCRRAQWEIRAMAKEMLRLCKKVAPVIFQDAGPPCLRGPCPEGSFSCGKMAEVREEFAWTQ
ncbi:MAG: FAD-dependent thymidylate synthase [Aquificota bacterium]|nr:MAG: FAD-dependent thymidylate synthase [Aquificota bacterium]RLD99081.1 MAG: FAD-dependent thymidylate synthase [Aquificota bacterium]